MTVGTIISVQVQSARTSTSNSIQLACYNNKTIILRKLTYEYLLPIIDKIVGCTEAIAAWPSHGSNELRS